jgi:predicted AAA+ superfamily ATPase
MKDIFKQIIIDFHGAAIPRPSHRDLNLPGFTRDLRKAFVFVGMRRSGKTWALYQQMQTLTKNSYEDSARLETAVFLHLRRRNKEMYYYQTESGREVDLLSSMPNGEISLCQVTLSMSNPKPQRREIEPLQQAMKELNVKVGTIVTLDKEQEIKIGRNKVYYVSLREFLLS